MILDLSGSGTTAEWAAVVVTLVAIVLASILAYKQTQIMKRQQTISENQERDRTWMEKKAYLIAQSRKLPDSYPIGGYIIEIQNQGNGEAKDVETLIKDKPISESGYLLNGQKNISIIAPKDRIFYRLKDSPPVGINVSISWTDDTGKYHYEKKLINY